MVALLWSGGGAQAQQLSGGVRGVVQDREFFTPVPGARLELSSTGQVATTDEDGRFFFGEVEPGTYNLDVSASGFVREMVRGVAVVGGQVREVTASLTPEVVTLDDFVVTPGDLLGDSDAIQLIEVRQDVDSFVDILGEDFIQKSGGGDAGALLTKVVGTSVVDSKYVVVRGLSDRYNTVFLNGARVPSSDPDRRAVNVDIFPSGLIASLSNSKTFTPDLPGEATGGHIDIGLKGVPEQDFFKFKVGLGYNTSATGREDFVTSRNGGVGLLGKADSLEIPPLMQSAQVLDLDISPSTFTAIPLRRTVARQINPVFGVTTKEAPMDFSFSASAGKRTEFFGRPLGILAAVTYSREYEHEDEIVLGTTVWRKEGTFIPFAYRRIEEYRGPVSEDSLLAGLLVTAGWEATEDDTIQATLFANLAAEDTASFQFGEDEVYGDPTNDIPAYNETQFRLREIAGYAERRLTFLQLAGDHTFAEAGDAELRWNLNYGFSSQNEPDLRFGNYASRVIQGERRFTSPGADFTGQPYERIWRRLDDENFSANAQTKIPLAIHGEKRIDIQAGGGFDHTHRDYRADNYGVNNFGRFYNLVPHPEQLSPNDLVAITPPDTVPVQLLGYPDSTDAFIFRSTSPELYNAQQNIASAFLAAKFDVSDKVEALFGGRIEYTDIQLDSDITELFGQDTATGSLLTFDPITGEPYTEEELENPIALGDTDLLPALSVSWEFFEDMRLRFALSRTVARPTFKEIAPVFTRDPGNSRRFFGNRRLQLSDISNIDLRWEWFPEPGDVIAASVFTKRIDRPIEFVNLGRFATVANEESAVVYGFELEAQKNLESIWPMLQGVAMGSNFSFIRSEVELTDFSRDQRTAADLDPVRPLQGQPEYIFNINMTYDNEDLGLGSGIFLNVTGPLLHEAGSIQANQAFPDVIQEARTTVDFTISKKINDTWSLGFKAGNLLDSPRRRLFPNGDIQEEARSGRTYSISLSGSW